MFQEALVAIQNAHSSWVKLFDIYEHKKANVLLSRQLILFTEVYFITFVWYFRVKFLLNLDK